MTMELDALRILSEGKSLEQCLYPATRVTTLLQIGALILSLQLLVIGLALANYRGIVRDAMTQIVGRILVFLAFVFAAMMFVVDLPFFTAVLITLYLTIAIAAPVTVGFWLFWHHLPRIVK